MEKKISISNIRSSYAKRVESNVRNFNSYVREVLKDWDAIHAAELTQIEIEAAAEAKKAAAEAKKANASAEAKKAAAEAKQRSAAAAKRAAEAREAQQQSSSEARNELREICARYNLQREDISLNFLKEFSFYANSKGIICDAKRIEIEAEAEARAKFGAEYEFKENSKGVVYMLIPVKIWSASKLLQKLTSAAAAREAAKKAASAAEREAAAAEREAKRIEAYRKRVADFDAKRAAAEQQQSSSEAAAEQQSK